MSSIMHSEQVTTYREEYICDNCGTSSDDDIDKTNRLFKWKLFQRTTPFYTIINHYCSDQCATNREEHFNEYDHKYMMQLEKSS